MEHHVTDLKKRVLCFACKKPIHIDELGGVIGLGKDKEAWFHNNFVCLVKLYLIKHKFINFKKEK